MSSVYMVFHFPNKKLGHDKPFLKTQQGDKNALHHPLTAINMTTVLFGDTLNKIMLNVIAYCTFLAFPIRGFIFEGNSPGHEQGPAGSGNNHIPNLS